MQPRHGLRALGALLVAFALVMAACTDDDAEDTTTTAAADDTTTTAAPPETTIPSDTGGEEVAVEIPFLARWEASPHNAAEDEAFVHWNEDDPQVVPAACARCHSTPGYLDYIGADGTAANSTDADHPVGTTIECVACHNDVTVAMDTVLMPSGIELTGLGDESRCMQCHQGRHSTVSVNAAIEEAGVDDDTVSEDLGFLNIHYYAAAASKYGTEAKGGYEYEGKTYDAFFQHVEGYSTCIQCHDVHTLELKIDECSVCHTGVASVEDLYNVRMPGSLVDYDGDGDLSEGIYYELEGVRALLFEAIQRYAAENVGAGIVYDSHAYPYFFTDLNGDGEAGEDEANYGNQYATWTPRLLKAAYNYQVSLKDPGAFAHGGKYHIQLMSDSIEDLNSVLADPVATEATHRIDHGHFAGSEEAFRHWDEDDPAVIPGSCSRCHSAGGLPLYVQEGVTIAQPPANGFLCSTCHANVGETWDRYEVASVTFPSGNTVDSGDNSANLCMTCHQGRESSASVDRLIADIGDDETSEALRFLNVHYFPAGATLFGTEAAGGYEYAGQSYVGRRAHVEAYDTCTECHGAHSLQVKVEECGVCHVGVETKEDLLSIRMDATDYDGDGADEGIYGEIDTMRGTLIAAMQAYANAQGLDAIVYDSHAYPYFFIDLNADGVPTPDEANYGNRYVTWTPKLLRAAYNYQYATKDPGGFAHNPKYVIQLLYDALASFNAADGLTRP